ncbi:RrF2 family transcriptional regulator [Pseudobdellovibrio sp. HCB154]|uniref:RrF2 family transcriptional regulator n=1 Tax=Pseudobdellovibrio sp. HCB154 TaxID=3386277 RepID=UPI0039170501
MKLNKKVEYALMALKHFSELDHQEGTVQATVSAKDIAEANHSPAEVTARVLQTLSSHGILKAEYGLHGGYRLAKDLSKVSVYDLVTIVDGSTNLAKCISDKECDLLKNCTIVSPVENLNKKVQDFYKSISVEEVFHV